MSMLLAAGSVATAFACGAPAESDGDSSEDAITKPGDTSPPWLYEGPLPALESPRIVTSIVGHTLHVTGLLPAGYDVDKLPPHAEQAAEGDRVRIHVVYPVATGQMKNGAYNNVPGSYDHLNVRPYRPNDPAAANKEHWGGFPFLNYHDARRFAMHGPIDFTEDFDAGPEPKQDWHLVRGRVSLGCNRMQGEHVLELTQLLGFDMSKPWTTELNKPDPKNKVEGKWIPANLKVLAEPAYDTYGDSIVDVDYPKDQSVPPLPADKDVHVFKTWDANVMRSWACPVKPADDPNKTKSVKRTDARFDGHYCERNPS
jgi:hypothetical protein